MPATRKISYHPSVLIAFYLHCLPSELLQYIPRSTQHEWQHRDMSVLFGYQWYMHNQQLFHTLQQVGSNKRLLRVNLALLRIIAIKRFMIKYAGQMKKRVFNTPQTVLGNILKVKKVVGLQQALRLLQLSYNAYLALRKIKNCSLSPLNLCRIKHPAQLLKTEITIVKQYCLDKKYLHWPLASVYHQLKREGATFFSIQTFYKYAGLLQLKRKKIAGRRKNHHTGIRASAPLQVLHADVTIFKTADNSKNYIYLVQDNFSRTILKYTVATQCKASITFDNLNAVKEEYLKPAGIETCELITDDGSENHGPVKEIIDSNGLPIIKHLIAQQDITYSNPITIGSMIEAANKQLKYRFLYHHPIADHNALHNYVQQAIDDYNNRPHHNLCGLTPLEVLNGKMPAQVNYAAQMNVAKTRRLMENKKLNCCSYSF